MAGIVATTPQQFDLLKQDYEAPADNCRMIPPGYDDNRFFPVGEGSRNAIRHRLGFSGKVVLAIGRLARNKGYDLLLQGFSVLAAREPEVVLHLAVGGTNLTKLEDTILIELKQLAARLGLQEKVRFGSFIPDDQMADYYRAADLFVLSSRYEPFGMTAIEAMASGTPTVVTVSSWYLAQATPENIGALQNQPADAGLQVTVVYSSSRHLDVLPKDSNKGAALGWLCTRVGVDLIQS